jgi:xanthine/uracil/vitamin C permease (AzgA family)
VFRRFRPAARPLARSVLRTGLASVLVGLLAWLWSPSGLWLIPTYALLGALYLVLLLTTGEIRRRDLALIAGLLPRPGRGKGA